MQPRAADKDGVEFQFMVYKHRALNRLQRSIAPCVGVIKHFPTRLHEEFQYLDAIRCGHSAWAAHRAEHCRIHAHCVPPWIRVQ